MVLELLRSLSYLLIAAVLVPLLTQLLGERHLLRQIAIGMIFAGGGIASMLDPFVLTDGVILDSRNVVTILAAPFGGPLAAAITALPLIALRAWMGGAGALPGCVGILACALVGLAYWRVLKQEGSLPSLTALALMGLFAGLTPSIAISTLVDPELGMRLLTEGAGITAIAVSVMASLFVGFTVRNDAERALTALRLKALVDRAPVMLYQRIVRPDGSLRFIFESYWLDRLLGVSQADAERDAENWLGLMLPEDRRRFDAERAASQAAGEPFWRFEGRYPGRDGGIVWLRTEATMRRTGDGTLIWDGILLDITDEKAMRERQSEAEAARKSALSELASQLEVTVGKALGLMGIAVVDMHKVATGMADNAGGMAERAGHVASQAQNASLSVGSVARAAEQIVSSIHELTHQTSHADQAARDVASYVRTTSRDVAELTAAADRVSAVLDLIEDIAARTNLLALNATIEAARAGVAGRGFAVVAGEVKSLAEQTQKATRDIAETLQDIRSAAATTSDAVVMIEAKVGAIEQSSGMIAALADTQAAITSGIAADTQLVARSASAVSQSVGMVGAEMRANGETAVGVAAAARQVEEQTRALDRYVGDFLRDVRGRL